MAKIEEESNSSQSQDGDSQDGSSLGTTLQYQNATGRFIRVYNTKLLMILEMTKKYYCETRIDV